MGTCDSCHRDRDVGAGGGGGVHWHLIQEGVACKCLSMLQKPELEKLGHGLSLEKLSPNFSSSLFVILVKLLHPLPSLFLYGLLLSLQCFSIFVKYDFYYYFFIFTLFVAKRTQNIMPELVCLTPGLPLVCLQPVFFL